MSLRILLSSVLLFMLFSCEKPLFDMRNKYVGEYLFEVTTYRSYFDEEWHSDTSNYSYNGEVEKINGDKVLVQYGETSELELLVMEDLSLNFGRQIHRQSIEGGFESKGKLNLRYNFTNNGGSTTYDIKGVKND